MDTSKAVDRHWNGLGNLARASLIVAMLVTTSAPMWGQTIVIDGATVHPVSAEPYVGRVVLENGRIVAAGPEVDAPASAERIDAVGLHVFPGFFDALSSLGLSEVGAVSATVDTAEQGTFNPHLLAATAIHPASEVIPVTRAEGITQTVVAPQADRGGVIAGQAALVRLGGWTVEEMTIDARIGMMLVWPEIRTSEFDFATFSRRQKPFGEAEETATAARHELLDWLDAARHYAGAQAAGSERLTRDLRLEALARVLDGGQRVFVAADAERDIRAAVAFAEDQGLDIVIVGGRDAWKAKDLLAENAVPVILGKVQSLPQNDDDPYDRPFRTAGELAAAGIPLAFGSAAGGGFGPGGPHSARTLPIEVGMATAFGLDHEVALRALTLGPAEILGVDDDYGSIEVGKVANLIVTDGNPLEITTRVLHVLIDGRIVPTANKHRDLYERYRARPRPVGEP